MEFADIVLAHPHHMQLDRIIWISIKPLAKIFLPALAGVALVKAKKLDDAGVRVAAQIQIYAALPCLVFSNIVPSITPDAYLDIFVCIAAGLLYMLVAAAIAFGLRKVVWVPDNFRWGFIVAATWSNWGNLPLSVIESVFSEKPFGSPGDVKLGIAFCSFFILVNNSTVFAGPGLWMIKQDFKENPSRAEARLPVLSNEADQGVESGGRGRFDTASTLNSDQNMTGQKFPRRLINRAKTTLGIPSSWHARRWPLVDGGVHRQPDTPSLSETECDDDDAASDTASDHGVQEEQPLLVSGRRQSLPRLKSRHSYHNSTASQSCDWICRKVFTPLRRFCRNFFTPVTTALLAAVIIALIPPLKGLFTTLPPEPNNPRLPTTPDGRPIFGFLLDAAGYLGAAAVPLSLLVLGASTARMKVPTLSSLPIAAIFSVTFLKLVLLPCLALATFTILKNADLIRVVTRKDRLLEFVVLYMSSGLTATNQVALSALAAAQAGFSPGEGNLDLLCAFIVIQYFVYPITGTIVIALCLSFVAT